MIVFTNWMIESYGTVRLCLVLAVAFLYVAMARDIAREVRG